MAETNARSIFGVGVYPPYISSDDYRSQLPSVTPSNAIGGSLQGSCVPGLVAANNDFISLPASGTDVLEYYAANGTEVTAGSWPLAHTDLDATCDNWVGFMNDLAGLVIYCVAFDAGLGKYFWASIDAAGVLGTVYSAIPTTALTTAPNWGTNMNAPGHSNVFRTADGSGNLFVRGYSGTTSGIEELELTLAANSVATDTVLVADGHADYKTAAGLYAGGGLVDTNYVDSGPKMYVSGALRAGIAIMPLDSGTPYINSGVGTRYLQWGGKIIACSNSGQVVGPRCAEVDDFENFFAGVASTVKVA